MTRSGRETARVMVMARYPTPGAGKTRLVPALGEEGAARTARELGVHALARLRPLAASRDAIVEVHNAGGSRAELREWLGTWPRFVPQPTGGLGDKLAAAFAHAFGDRAGRAVAVAADCPAIRASLVREALDALASADVVLGPATDGGFWLLGVRREAAAQVPRLLAEVEWGTSRVLEQTRANAAAAGLELRLSTQLADVDRPEDLQAWERLRAAAFEPPRTVSVVIPALDEEAHVAAAVASARDGGAAEVIVADGGSRDGTVAAARAAGARVVAAPRGRAPQMNAGAAAATGEVLLFLHADTLLPAGFARAVLDALAAPDALSGAFAFRVADDCRMRSLVELAGRARLAIFRVPYGDQALFVRADTFADLGGYREQPIMEDWELARALRRLGGMRLLREGAVTSGRRWTGPGLVTSTLAYLAVIGAYRLGADPAVLDGWRR